MALLQLHVIRNTADTDPRPVSVNTQNVLCVTSWRHDGREGSTIHMVGHPILVVESQETVVELWEGADNIMQKDIMHPVTMSENYASTHELRDGQIRLTHCSDSKYKVALDPETIIEASCMPGSQSAMVRTAEGLYVVVLESPEEVMRLINEKKEKTHDR